MKKITLLLVLLSTVLSAQQVDYYEYGSYYIEETIEYENPIVGQGKEGVILWTDKPIDIVKISGVYGRPVIKGVTFKYVGNIHGKEVAAVHIGGEGFHSISDAEFEFDVIGDKNMYTIEYKAYHPKNENYLEFENESYDFSFENLDDYKSSFTGSGAHALWIDFKDSKNWSNVTGSDIKVRAYRTNTALKITTAKGSKQYLNTNDFDFKSRGAKTHFFIDRMGSGNFKFKVQELETLSENELHLPYFYFNGQSSALDITFFDRSKRKLGGYIKGKNLTLKGYTIEHGMSTIIPYIDANVEEAEIMISPYTVDTFNTQSIKGDKTFMETVRIHRNKGKLIINQQEIRPIKNYNPSTLKKLIDMLKKTGIIYE